MQCRRKMACTLIAVFLLVSGCSTTQVYAPTTDAATREIKIKAGDDIRGKRLLH